MPDLTDTIIQIMSERYCTYCGKSKPNGLFLRSKRTKSGFHPWCKQCIDELVEHKSGTNRLITQ